ncbi:HypC/HybG/HupF family hydrogenase formation chaperone [Actinomadura gamaensis]|uniref:HypC/HybG/HupF family hydrogenase formation chaperone n=1 Tax=Actinomadura gamaensis TaxID=1763541 RepID=A0ABV9TSL0_9ACTN
MCLGLPGRVIAVEDGADEALVEVGGVRREVHVGLIDDGPVLPGEWVLIHVGFALSRIDEAEAAATLELLRQAGRAYEDELAALRGEST